MFLLTGIRLLLIVTTITFLRLRLLHFIFLVFIILLLLLLLFIVLLLLLPLLLPPLTPWGGGWPPGPGGLRPDPLFQRSEALTRFGQELDSPDAVNKSWTRLHMRAPQQSLQLGRSMLCQV